MDIWEVRLYGFYKRRIQRICEIHPELKSWFKGKRNKLWIASGLVRRFLLVLGTIWRYA